MKHISPSIIAVVGAPRTGKSYLAKKIAAHLEAAFFLEEGASGYPERIVENLAQNIRPLERQLWFRTSCVEKHLAAQQCKQAGQHAVLDIFWLSTHLYTDVLFTGFEHELMTTLRKQDEQLLDYPDCIIYLTQSEEKTKEFVRLGGRSFDASDTFYHEVILPSHLAHETFFAEHANSLPCITLDRTDIDFDDETSFLALMEQVAAVLQQPANNR